MSSAALPGLFSVALPANEALAELAIVEHGTHLAVDCFAELAFDPYRDHRRKTRGNLRNNEHRDRDQRQGRDHGPGDHPPPCALVVAAAAVDGVRAVVDRGGKLGIADFEPGQHWIAAQPKP